MTLTLAELKERQSKLAARSAQYLSLGFDRGAAVRGVVEAASPLASPVLDIGTGPGHLALELARRGLSVVSVDPKGEDQEVAAYLASLEGLGERLWLIEADAASLPFEDGHFPLILSMDVLHHLDSEGPVLAEAARLLSPRGRLVLTDFSPEGFDLVARVHREEGGDHPVGPVTQESARAFLEGLGMTPLADRTENLHRITVYGRTGG